MDFIQIRDWGIGLEAIAEEQPILISGPCSAETEEQLLRSCLELAQTGQVHILRAGIWKPRTRPNSFEGVGKEGLVWLQKAKELTGLPICVEVAQPEHVELALAAGVDILWIGARTSVNPFAVQALAEALAGKDVPVMVKNPINPDLKLWMGAIERFYQQGIRKIAAIHRGFSVYGEQRYRNAPIWELPIELKRQWPNLELIGDPSHIAGKRELLGELAQQALYLNFDGLMIESHCQPEQAWRDAAQQINAADLEELIGKLEPLRAASSDPDFLCHLNELRKEIDYLDHRLLKVLARRMQLVRQIGEYKYEKQISILQLERWAEIYKDRCGQAQELQLAQEFISLLIQAIHQESIRQQEAVFASSRILDRLQKA